MRILVIDNYDSFVFNLVQYLGQLGAECDVRRNNEIAVGDIAGLAPDGILLSPGPGTPERAGICLDVIRECGGDVPIFGVCLGHQAFGAAYGATVTRAPELLHGKTSLVHHDSVGVLTGLPNPFTATRYHSLAVVEDTLTAMVLDHEPEPGPRDVIVRPVQTLAEFHAYQELFIAGFGFGMFQAVDTALMSQVLPSAKSSRL